MRRVETTQTIRRVWVWIPSRLEAYPSLHPKAVDIEADHF
jgi:hypothetical protein